MKVAVLSGKGGTGKTFVSINLACAMKQASYVDCDVEEPNGHLFLRPANVVEESVSVLLPEFDETLCNGCRKCSDFCHFNALIYLMKKPIVFPEICHSCLGCKLVCDQGAISEREHVIGCVKKGFHKDVCCISGGLNPGEVSGIPVIERALHMAEDKNVMIDCPPGSACTVMESVKEADVCLLVAEPSSFGFHNFKMVYELVTLMKKPCMVIMNKVIEEYAPLESFCREYQIPVIARIPYSDRTASLAAHGHIAYEEDEEMRKIFDSILQKVIV